jgi:tetratricopeptide (TPR) repeat protein
MKLLLIVELVLRSALPPFYSFALIENILNKKISKNPNNTFAKWILANYYVEYKKYQEAALILESLQDYYKNNKATLLLLARIYYNLNQPEKVIKILDKGKVLLENDKENYYYGISLMELGKHADSIPYLERYLKNHKIKDSKVYINIGICYYKISSYKEALCNYEKAKNLGGDKEEIANLINSCKENP